MVLDPEYHLKGAARPAQDYYRPPNYEPPVQPIDVFVVYRDRLFEHEEGRQYLVALRDLGITLHNLGNKTRDAITIFLKLLEVDPLDHLVSYKNY